MENDKTNDKNTLKRIKEVLLSKKIMSEIIKAGIKIIVFTLIN